MVAHWGTTPSTASPPAEATRCIGEWGSTQTREGHFGEGCGDVRSKSSSHSNWDTQESSDEGLRRGRIPRSSFTVTRDRYHLHWGQPEVSQILISTSRGTLWWEWTSQAHKDSSHRGSHGMVRKRIHEDKSQSHGEPGSSILLISNSSLLEKIMSHYFQRSSWFWVSIARLEWPTSSSTSELIRSKWQSLP